MTNIFILWEMFSAISHSYKPYVYLFSPAIHVYILTLTHNMVQLAQWLECMVCHQGGWGSNPGMDMDTVVQEGIF